MKQRLLATVAVAAVVGFGGVAAAQDTQKSPSGSMQEQKGGGMSSHSTKQPSGQAAESEQKGGKQNERLGQGSTQEQKGMNQHGMEQKGAQGERGTNVKGSQEQRGAQRHPSTTEDGTTEQGQAGATGGRGGSVQLSEQQRSKIKTIVTEGHAPRFSGNVNFDVKVGTKIPRSVHIVALPDDIVRLVPEYRGYDYILVRDEILIVDPKTLEIVAVIPA
jgi:hypothetical protein